MIQVVDTGALAIGTGAIIVTVVFGSIVTLTWLNLHYRARGTVKSGDLASIEARLVRIEQAVDAISVEAERISEGQRFTTKLLSERATPRSTSP